jgi:hypothetical protein
VLQRSQHYSVSILNCFRLEGLCWVCGRGDHTLQTTPFRITLGSTQPSVQLIKGPLSTQVKLKLPTHETDHTSPCFIVTKMHVKFLPHITHTFTAWCFRHRSYLLYISLWYVAETGVLVMLWATTSIQTHYWTSNLPCLSHCCSGCHIIINLLLFDMCHGSTALFSTSSRFTVALLWGKKATRMVRLLSTSHTNCFPQRPLHWDWRVIFASLWIWLAHFCFMRMTNIVYAQWWNNFNTPCS